MNGRTRLLFVFGDPIAHSLSPFMHNAALSEMGLNMAYLPLHVLPGQLEKVMELLRCPNVAGANVTIPHKEKVIPFLDELSSESRLIGAVNTIVNRNGKLTGTTTDPDGFLNSLTEEGIQTSQRNVLILGSGGTARTVAFAFAMKTSPRSIHLAARNPEKLKPIQAEINTKLNLQVTVGKNTGEELAIALEKAELIINCTSAGMKPRTEEMPMDPGVLQSRHIVYDLVYNPLRTRFLIEAEKKGCKAVSGLGMLIHQGKKSMEIWLDRNLPASLFSSQALAKVLEKEI